MAKHNSSTTTEAYLHDVECGLVGRDYDLTPDEEAELAPVLSGRTAPEPDWTVIEARALDLFTTTRNLDWDDSLLAALVEQRAPDLAARALRLIANDGQCSFSLAFRAVRETDRFFDAAPLLSEVRHAA